MSLQSRNLPNLLAITAILIFVVACACPNLRENGERSRGDSKTEEVKEDAQPSEKNEDSVAKKDEGDFIVEFTEVKNEKFESLERSLRDKKVLEKAADKLNRSLSLPHDITLRTKDCNQGNAFYDSRDQSITVCYELMEYFFKLFKMDGDSDPRANERMNKAITFVFLHELGHALIDGYDLPITGNEEDAADRCSSFICIEELGDDGVDAIVAAAEAFAIESKFSKPGKRNMADEHLLQEQRFFNSLCMIYGSDPTKYANFEKNGLLPKARAERCPAEYARTSKSWEELLRPWRKD